MYFALKTATSYLAQHTQICDAIQHILLLESRVARTLSGGIAPEVHYKTTIKCLLFIEYMTIEAFCSNLILNR